MRAFPIRNEEDHSRALELVDQLWDAQPGSPEHDLLFVMAELIESYEVRNRAQSMVAPDPLVVVRFKLKELGISQRELGRRLGWPTGRVSEVLGGKRQLTLNMVRDLERVLGIDPGVLVGGKPRTLPTATQDPPSNGEGVWLQLPKELAHQLLLAEGETLRFRVERRFGMGSRVQGSTCSLGDTELNVQLKLSPEQEQALRNELQAKGMAAPSSFSAS